MELTVSVSEVAELFKAIQEKPGRVFEMMRMDVPGGSGEIPYQPHGCRTYPSFRP